MEVDSLRGIYFDMKQKQATEAKKEATVCAERDEEGRGGGGVCVMRCVCMYVCMCVFVSVLACVSIGASSLNSLSDK